MQWTLAFFLFPLLVFGTLQKIEIELSHQVLRVEVADTDESRAHGLMGRKILPDGEGMLFVYQKPKILCFWMKNVLIPLSVGFFDSERRLINIEEMDPPAPGAIAFLRYLSKAPAAYALEVPQGWFSKHQIGPGSKFSFHHPSDSVK